jgi:hypothetical protein
MVGRNAVTFPFPYLDHVALHRGPEATAAPRGKQRYDTPVKNGIHRVGRLCITGECELYGPRPSIVSAQSTGATMGGLLEAPER